MARKKSGSGRLVYSTDGSHRRHPEKETLAAPPGDGIVRIRRESKGRGGKAVTVITGLPGDAEALKARAKALKQRCGVGGAVKQGQIEIQGDQRNTIKAVLEAEGLVVKLAGG